MALTPRPIRHAGNDPTSKWVTSGLRLTKEISSRVSKPHAEFRAGVGAAGMSSQPKMLKAVAVPTLIFR